MAVQHLGMLGVIPEAVEELAMEVSLSQVMLGFKSAVWHN